MALLLLRACGQRTLRWIVCWDALFEKKTVGAEEAGASAQGRAEVCALCAMKWVQIMPILVSVRAIAACVL